MPETVLIVDDEDGVRRTFREWLADEPGVEVLVAADAEAALILANHHAVDLAVLDWNLGSGSDGLQLLEDLGEFHPDVVAILITGFAHQATPLDALRMGVRDYLDKNQDLTREKFLAAVRKQLARLAPAKRQRQFNQSLAAFRTAVEQVLPLIRGAATLNDPVPLPEAVKTLLRFVLRATGARDGAVVVRHVAKDGAETIAAYDPNGESLPCPTGPFGRTLAAAAIGAGDVCIAAGPAPGGTVDLFPFEANRSTILAAPLRVGAGIHAVLELFDKPEFTSADKALASSAAEVGADLLRQVLAERQTHRLLADAVEAALAASQAVSNSMTIPDSPTEAVMDQLRAGLASDPTATLNADTGLKLVEAVRRLADRHGPNAVEHCIRTIGSLHRLLDEQVGPG
ncbi:MAG TPA: response regulator [Fimbriiglobus sp.]|jgi:DNA-binding NarL/FixJ family response regulator